MEEDSHDHEAGRNAMNRRQFLALTAAAVTGPGLASGAQRSTSAERLVDAGPVSTYASEGVYDRFRDQGFFVVRRGKQLLALSAFCTHRKCKLAAERDHSFYCKCHGSTFDPEGKVTLGPARRDLPRLPVSVNDHAHLLVKVPSA
ncbi:MAG: Rieske (2Fe-2S) protein [Verrucomicrobia bacterium]|nr:Rieske (2Fe-2S) protein [Verrucomicrobiota bacterium]